MTTETVVAAAAAAIEEEKVKKVRSAIGSDLSDPDILLALSQSGDDPDAAVDYILRGTVAGFTRTVTATGVRISAPVKEEPEQPGLEPAVEVKEEPEGMEVESEIAVKVEPDVFTKEEEGGNGVSGMGVSVKKELVLGDCTKQSENSVKAEPETCGQGREEVRSQTDQEDYSVREMELESEVSVKGKMDLGGCKKQSENSVKAEPETCGQVREEVRSQTDQEIGVGEMELESEVSVKGKMDLGDCTKQSENSVKAEPETCRQEREEVRSQTDQQENGVREMELESEVFVKGKMDVGDCAEQSGSSVKADTGKQEVKSQGTQHENGMSEMASEESSRFPEAKSDGVVVKKEEPDGFAINSNLMVKKVKVESDFVVNVGTSPTMGKEEPCFPLVEAKLVVKKEPEDFVVETKAGVMKEGADVLLTPEVKPVVSNSRIDSREGMQMPMNVKKETVDDKRVMNGVVIEDGEFPEEKDWYLVGRTVITGLSTTKGRKLVDNEIVHFVFPKNHSHYNSQWIVRFSTKRSGEVGRLPMQWGKCVEPLVKSGKVKVRGRCIAAPTILQMMQEIMLYVSFYIHHSIFTELDKSSWKLEASSNIDSTLYPLLTLFKLLEVKPYQKAEFTPAELDSRKRSLDLEVDLEEAASVLPMTKRRKGCQQYPEQGKDEQVITESSLNKLVGAADTYNLEEMDPPRTLTCDLRPYQKQALYWMSESEKGVDVEKAEKTLHPCWAAYRICDGRASSIYVNIFSGEATTQFPTATQMARGGILADAMGLGKTVMTIALILARRGKGNTSNQESTDKKNSNTNTSRRAKGGTLIVCPMALLGQWKDELETHSEPESISIFVHYGGDRTSDPKVIAGYDVVLTTYGVLTAAYKSDSVNSIYHRVDWYRVVLDEAHTIKSWKTMGAQAAFTLSSHCRWCLTGTPLQNNLEDLYSLLCFLHVEPWCNWAWWNKLIQRPYENGDPRGLKLVKAILRPLMLRRTKETKDKEGRPILVLPPTDIQVVECEQSEAEHDFYEALFRRSKVKFDEFVAQGKVLHNYANILELLLRLRQCCNHPFLVMSRADSQQYADLNKLARKFLEANASPSSAGQTAPSRAYIEEVVDGIRRGENMECPICMEYADDPVLTPCAHRMCRECLLSSWRTPVTGLCPICRTVLKKTDLISCPTETKFRVDVVKNWKESSKVTKLLECLERICRSCTGEKSIIFSQWTSFLDLLEIPLKRKGIGFLRFDGSLAQKQRERVLKEFNESKEKPVLLMSLKAGGVGLNLTAASNVFLMDPWWNPAVEEQAIMRIHRIGQKRTVSVRRFIVKDTVEERMQQVQARKQRMIAGALTDEEVRSARLEELKMLFR